MVGESAKRHVEVGIAGEPTPFCGLTDHSSPIFATRMGKYVGKTVEKKQRHDQLEQHNHCPFQLVLHQLFTPLFLS